MSPISDSVVKSTERFLSEIASIEWLREAGMQSNEKLVVQTVSEAFDSDKRAWERNTHGLEEEALTRIGNSAIDWVFEVTSKAIQEPLYAGVVAYFERRRISDPTYDVSAVDAGLVGEMMECVKRDIAWAAIEAALQRPRFFSAILHHYREGRWPCSWSGEFPSGSVVVL